MKAISKLKIVDLSKYMDKRFKAIKILQGSTQSATHCKIDESDAKSALLAERGHPLQVADEA